MRGEERVHVLDEPALQLVLILHSELLDARLDARTGLPLRLVGLVAADVDELDSGTAPDFRQHVLHEARRWSRIGVEDVSRRRPSASHVRRLARDAELRIRGDRGERVPGHLDLGHDVDEASRAYATISRDVVLRVEAAVSLAVELPRRGVRRLFWRPTTVCVRHAPTW